MTGNKIFLSSLCDKFLKKPLNRVEPGWIEYVRAYALYFVGSYVLPDSSPGKVHACYLACMDDISQIGSYAWGAAALEKLHMDLSKKNVNTLAFSLMVLVFEYIPGFLSQYVKLPEGYLPKELPLLPQWSRLLGKRLRNNNFRDTAKYQTMLNRLKEIDFSLEPYQWFRNGEQRLTEVDIEREQGVEGGGRLNRNEAIPDSGDTEYVSVDNSVGNDSPEAEVFNSVGNDSPSSAGRQEQNVIQQLNSTSTQSQTVHKRRVNDVIEDEYKSLTEILNHQQAFVSSVEFEKIIKKRKRNWDNSRRKDVVLWKLLER